MEPSSILIKIAILKKILLIPLLVMQNKNLIIHHYVLKIYKKKLRKLIKRIKKTDYKITQNKIAFKKHYFKNLKITK